MLELDGSMGEGGGQIVRTALSLSVLEAEPFHLTQIRAGRNPQGLRPQHQTAVEAAAAIGNATVTGATVGSTSLTFTPETVRPGTYHFEVETAGSAVLVLQTVLPPLLTAPGPSRVTVGAGPTSDRLRPSSF
jgi:RNA 3'-terminal phosphate cyclase (ATP)